MGLGFWAPRFRMGLGLLELQGPVPILCWSYLGVSENWGGGGGGGGTLFWVLINIRILLFRVLY